MKAFWSSLARTLSRGTFARNVLVIASGSTLGQLLVVAASPLLTRMYTPEQFGVLGVYIAGILLLSGIATMRYELAIPLPAEDREARSLLQLALGLSAGFSALLLVVSLVGKGFPLAWVGLEELQPYAPFLPLGTWLISSYQSLTYWAVRKGRYHTLAATKLWQALGNIAVQLVLGITKLGTLGLLLGDAAGRSAGITQLARGVPGLFTPSCTGELLQVARRYSKFPMWSMGSTLINRLGLQLPQLFVATTFGPREAGWYLLTQRVLGTPISLVGQAVAQVFLNRIAELRREDPERAPGFYLGIVTRMALVGGLPILVGGFLLGEAFGWIFGPEWVPAGRIVQLLTPMFAIQWTFSPTSQILIVFERQELQLLWDASRLVALAASLYYVRWTGGDVFAAVTAISMAMSLAYLGLGAMNYHAVRTS